MFYFFVAKSFVELTRYLFTMPGVKVFLSQRICQDALEQFFGCQRQRGATHENPNALEFFQNTQALRVVNTASHVVKGNCRGTMKEKAETDQENQPLPKRRRKRKWMCFCMFYVYSLTSYYVFRKCLYNYNTTFNYSLYVTVHYSIIVSMWSSRGAKGSHKVLANAFCLLQWLLVDLFVVVHPRTGIGKASHCNPQLYNH